MPIRLPYFSKTEEGQPLQRCIEVAAARAGWSPAQMAVAMSYFFEELAEQVCRGKIVRIPGFGLFAGYIAEPKKEGLVPRAIPSFAACRAFANQAKYQCPLDAERLNKALMNARRRAHPANTGKSDRSRPWVAMSRFRMSMRAQAKEMGLEIPGDD